MDVFADFETEFLAEFEGFFSPKIRWSPKKKKKKVFADFETEFSAEISNSKVFSPKIRWSPKKKKKMVFTEIESDFSAEIVRLRLVGGDASPNGAN